MKTAIIGAGVQGRKRRAVCGNDFVCFVDPNFPNWYKYTSYVPLEIYDSACVCTPSDTSYGVCYYLANKGKHILVEKPLWAPEQEMLVELQELADKKECVLYTAYNHRFEPAIINIKSLLDSGKIGKVYHCRMFYGNGTAVHVKDSWRDGGIGIFGEIGSHLLDLIMFLFNKSLPCWSLSLTESKAFENKAPDYISFNVKRPDLIVECTATYLSWKNKFTIDILGEEGSIHLNGLCKWGHTRLEWHERVRPSGVPEIHSVNWSMPDPTWQLEWNYFKDLCENKKYLEVQRTKDREINYVINTLVKQSQELVS